MPQEPTPPPDLFAMTLSQLEEAIGGAFMQQMLDRLSQQTFVGGKRVAVQELPSLPKQAATTVHRVKVTLHGSKPPVWRRIELPSAMRLDLVHEVIQVAFDWHGYHLHTFETVCGGFGAPDNDDDWAERKDESAVALAQVAAVTALLARLAEVLVPASLRPEFQLTCPGRRGEPGGRGGVEPNVLAGPAGLRNPVAFWVGGGPS